MFPLTHLYTAKSILGKETPDTAAGALFPDFGSIIGLGRNLCHEMGRDMLSFAREMDNQRGVDFALAALTHDVSLPGIDWYADEEYNGIRPGYCFQQGEKISKRVEKACNLSPAMAVWKSHNIMEMAFDVLTEKHCPAIGRTAEEALNNPHEVCLDFIGAYLGKEKDDLCGMFRRGAEIFSFDGSDINALADKFIVSLNDRHGIVDCDKDILADLICEAVDIIGPEYDGFMEESLKEIRSRLELLGLEYGI